MPLSLPSIPDLSAALRALVAQIPAGRVTTPGLLAASLGDAVAARRVGHFLLHHAHDDRCLCFRVVRAGGVLGPFPGGVAEKRLRLTAEGIEVIEDRVDHAALFTAFTTDRPLRTLAQFQNRLTKRIVLGPRRSVPQLVGGVDVSYVGPEEGVAAYALIEVATGQLVWSTTIRRHVPFPYITSYLTFRELPLLVALIDEVREQGRLSEIVLVDGTGVLHPRRAGIASALGVVTGTATVGVTKKMLCGNVDIGGMQRLESRPVALDDEPTGIALRPDSGSLRPLFVSPGSGIDLASSEAIVRAVLAARRLPLPLYWADRLSRQEAKSSKHAADARPDQRKRKNGR